MRVAIELVFALVIGVIVLLLLSTMGTNYISGAEATFLGWLP